MTSSLSVSSAAEAASAILDAASSGEKLEIRGRGTKAAIGKPERAGRVLDASGIAGIVDYDPAELVLTLRPGTPLAEVEALLAQRGQMLAFEPLDLAPVLGAGLGAGATATIGGTVAAGLAGARRLTRGGVRDHLLGFTAVSGRGEIFVAGGKVVKNVTGYDLPKLLARSWGRLALMTELTLKVLPAPREQETHVIRGLSPAAAYAAMARALGSQAEIAAVAYVPAQAPLASVTAFRFEGFAPSIAARVPMLAAALAGQDIEYLSDGLSFWAELRDVSALGGAAQLWRIILPAREMPRLAELLDAERAAWLADWAGGLIWAGWKGAPQILRDAVFSLGGHAGLVRADAETRSRVPAFHPLPPLLASLEARVRRAFDPAGVFENGRFEDQLDAN